MTIINPLKSRWKWGFLLLFHLFYDWLYQVNILTQEERGQMTQEEIIEYVGNWNDFSYVSNSFFFWVFALFLLHDGPRFKNDNVKLLNLGLEFLYAFALSYFTWDVWDQAFNNGERVYQGPALLVSGGLLLFLLLRLSYQESANYTLFTTVRILLARLKKWIFK